MKSYLSALLLCVAAPSVYAQSAPSTNVTAPAPPISAPLTPGPRFFTGLSDVSVGKSETGNETVELMFTGPAPIVNLKQSEKNIALDLGSAVIDPLLLQKQLPAAVRLVPKGPHNTTRVDVSLAKPVSVQAFQTSTKYVMELTSKDKPATSKPASAKSYSGRPISFNFQDVPVRTVLQLIAEDANMNIVVSDTVQGNVTLRLVNVAWDQALDIVLQAKGLDQRRNNKVIWVGPQEEIAKMEQAKEDARIALENRVDLETVYIPVNYHSATTIYKSLTEKQDGGAEKGDTENSFLSSRGRLVADERTNTLIISDIPKKIQQLREIVNAIDRPVDQVLIEARLVIATDSFARDLGARFGVFGQRQGTGNTQTIGGSLVNNETNTRGLNVNLPAGTFTNSNPGSLAYTLLGRNFSLDVELTAMQEESKGEVISNPRLITSNQREGVIRQGKEIGYVTITGSGTGAATPSVEFKEALLELKVTPTITNDNRVFLNLNVKKDEVDQFLDLGDYGAVPQINKREINTAVLVEDGQTVVIGGVYEFTDRNSLAKVPFLGDLPFLGNLFKKRGRSKEKAELLVFITPHTMLVGQRADPNSVLSQTR